MAIPLAGAAAGILTSVLLSRFNSALRKKNSPLKKTFDAAIDQVANGLSVDDAVKMITGSRDVAEVEERLKRYKKSMGQWLSEYIPKIIGGLAKGTGNFINARNSILANALMSSANSLIPEEEQRVYGNPYLGPTAMFTGGKLAKGALASIAGDTVGSLFEDFSRDKAAEFEKMRNTRALMEEGAPGLYFDAQRKQNAATKGK